VSSELEDEGAVVGARIISHILEDDDAFAEAVVDDASGEAGTTADAAAADASRAEPSLQDRIDNGQQYRGTGGRTGNRLPWQGPPDGLMYTANPQTGEITNYAEYDADGNIVKRVDVTGRAHAGVPTPHVLDFIHDVDPETGTVYPRAPKIPRVATPEEIP
jgi:Bacterial toxin 24